MAVAMPKLERDPKSGKWFARKAIPADVRDVFGKREDKPHWPAALTEQEATRRYCSWLGDIEAKIAAARTGQVALSDEQVKALAGRWYRERLRAEEQSGENPETLEAVLEVLRKPGETVNGLVANAVERLLQAEGLNADDASRGKLAKEVLHLHNALYGLLLRRSQGDHSADAIEPRIPEWKPPEAATKTEGQDGRRAKGRTMRLLDLFEQWAAHSEQGGNAEGTLARYRSVFAALSDYLKSPPVADITGADISRYFEHRMGAAAGKTKIMPRTARGVHRAALNSVFEWAIGKGLVTSNPVAGYRIKYRKGSEGRGRGFVDEEARAILDASLAIPFDVKHPTMSAAKRWVPFLCAYTGGRVGEMTQLRREDVQEQPGGFWRLRITPDAGTVKDRQERFVPLHPRLVELGFVAFVQASRAGPLFFEPSRTMTSAATKAKNRSTDLAKWVRKAAGITDRRVQPNHAWRHRFKTVARQAGMDEQYAEALAGHAPGSVGRRYGEHRPETLYREIQRLSPGSVEGRANTGE